MTLHFVSIQLPHTGLGFGLVFDWIVWLVYVAFSDQDISWYQILLLGFCLMQVSVPARVDLGKQSKVLNLK